MTLVETGLPYPVDTGERPVTLITESGDGASECSGTCHEHRVRVLDARMLDPEPTSDREGEVILLEVCDTALDGRTRCSLHSAFDDPGTPTGAAPRESVEVRVMAFC